MYFVVPGPLLRALFVPLHFLGHPRRPHARAISKSFNHASHDNSRRGIDNSVSLTRNWIKPMRTPNAKPTRFVFAVDQNGLVAYTSTVVLP